MSLYCTSVNWGKGFITHGEKAKGSIKGFPGDVWVVADNMREWMAKVNAVTITKSAAQTIVSDIQNALRTAWDDNNVEGESAAEKNQRIFFKPEAITVP